MKVVLTHNVVYKRAPKEFVTSAKGVYGFSSRLHKWGLKNTTDNLISLLEFEKKEGVRSTIFLRLGSGYLEESETLKEFQKNGWEFQLLFEPKGDPLGSFRLQRDVLEWRIGNVYGVRLLEGTLTDEFIELFTREALAFDSTLKAESLIKYNPVWIKGSELVELPIAFSFSDMLMQFNLDQASVMEYLRVKLETAVEINADMFLVEFPQELFSGNGKSLLEKFIDLVKEDKNLEFALASDVVKEFRKTKRPTI